MVLLPKENLLKSILNIGQRMNKLTYKESLQLIKDDAFLQEKRINIEECIESKDIPACLYCEEYEHCILLVDYTRTVASLIRS